MRRTSPPWKRASSTSSSPTRATGPTSRPLVADHSKEYLPWKWELGKAPDGRLIGLPTDVGSLAVCYRKDLFQAAGLPTERDQVSALWSDWNGFHEAGRKYKQGSGGKAFIDSITAVSNGVHVPGQR